MVARILYILFGVALVCVAILGLAAVWAAVADRNIADVLVNWLPAIVIAIGAIAVKTWVAGPPKDRSQPLGD